MNMCPGLKLRPMYHSKRIMLVILVTLSVHPLMGNAASLGLAQAKMAGNFSSTLTSDQQRRLTGWRQFITRHRHSSVQKKLQLVNAYLNQFSYRQDRVVNGEEENWATPYEFILQNGGDCEDFAIAKYFMLRALGVPEQELQITYVYHHTLNQYHMVLLHIPPGQGAMLVLDNLTKTIQPIAKNADIEPVYGFNQHYVWVLNKTAQRKQVSGALHLARWQALLSRMQRQPLESQQPASG
ncbi:MAG: sulfate adenylyltransferase [Gammaproteobacteria bacterium]|nr:sulfate adenylyltransferase [Gammaproteobacteria bacterium]